MDERVPLAYYVEPVYRETFNEPQPSSVGSLVDALHPFAYPALALGLVFRATVFDGRHDPLDIDLVGDEPPVADLPTGAVAEGDVFGADFGAVDLPRIFALRVEKVSGLGISRPDPENDCLCHGLASEDERAVLLLREIAEILVKPHAQVDAKDLVIVFA